MSGFAWVTGGERRVETKERALASSARAHGTSGCAQAVEMHRSAVPNGHGVVRGGVAKKRCRSVQSTLAFKVEAGHVRVFVRGDKLNDGNGPCPKTPTSAICIPCESDSGCASGHEKERRVLSSAMCDVKALSKLVTCVKI